MKKTHSNNSFFTQFSVNEDKEYISHVFCIMEVRGKKRKNKKLYANVRLFLELCLLILQKSVSFMVVVQGICVVYAR